MKNPLSWVKEILEANPELTPEQVWRATHKKLTLEQVTEAIEEYEASLEIDTEEEDN